MQFNGFADLSGTFGAGVYILCSKGVVVYIGKSKSMIGRVYTHRVVYQRKRRGKSNAPWLSTKAISFDEAHVMPCAVSDLDRLEREYIERYKPKYNDRLKTDAKVKFPEGFAVRGVVLNPAPKPTERFERRV